MMAEKKFIVVPTSQIEQALRIPALWAETIGDVKEAEQEAKKLALKHWKQYTVLSDLCLQVHYQRCQTK